MPTFTLNDIALHYQTFGDTDKPALIFSNSLGTNLSMWQQQLDYFQAHFLSYAMTHAAMAAPLHLQVLIRLNN